MRTRRAREHEERQWIERSHAECRAYVKRRGACVVPLLRACSECGGEPIAVGPGTRRDTAPEGLGETACEITMQGNGCCQRFDGLWDSWSRRREVHSCSRGREPERKVVVCLRESLVEPSGSENGAAFEHER
jgi:hypothetical protein